MTTKTFKLELTVDESIADDMVNNLALGWGYRPFVYEEGQEVANTECKLNFIRQQTVKLYGDIIKQHSANAAAEAARVVALEEVTAVVDAIPSTLVVE